MAIPYRTRRNLGRFGVVVLVLILVALLAVLCWIFWLGRYRVFTDNGIRFDFDHSSTELSGQRAEPPAPKETVSIYYNEGENAVDVNQELTQLSGYYISSKDLAGDLQLLKEQIQQLPPEMAIMVEVKNIRGEFNYATAVGDYFNNNVDQHQVEEFLSYLNRSGRYVIASLPAFQDRMYGLNNVDEGLFSTAGAFLYMDDEGCYWLNPSSEKVIGYLAQIATELRLMGFDEVVFDKFLFPDSQYYRFNGVKSEALASAAATLVQTCGGKTFAVSFASTPELELPEGRSRLYLRDVDAGRVDNVMEEVTVPELTINLVFLTEFHDTRYDACGALRPITAMK